MQQWKNFDQMPFLEQPMTYTGLNTINNTTRFSS